MDCNKQTNGKITPFICFYWIFYQTERMIKNERLSLLHSLSRFYIETMMQKHYYSRTI